ncbi:hypothetical protein LMG33810_000676 [Carnimonas sp. LMG 33810]
MRAHSRMAAQVQSSNKEAHSACQRAADRFFGMLSSTGAYHSGAVLVPAREAGRPSLSLSTPLRALVPVIDWALDVVLYHR